MYCVFLWKQNFKSHAIFLLVTYEVNIQIFNLFYLPCEWEDTLEVILDWCVLHKDGLWLKFCHLGLVPIDQHLVCPCCQLIWFWNRKNVIFKAWTTFLSTYNVSLICFILWLVLNRGNLDIFLWHSCGPTDTRTCLGI